MPTLEYKSEVTETLPSGYTVTVAVGSGGSALFERFVGVSRVQSSERGSATTATYGPFPVDSYIKIWVTTPRVTYSIDRYDNAIGDFAQLSKSGLSWDVTNTTLVFATMPIADPLVIGALWNNAGVVTVSAGPPP